MAGVIKPLAGTVAAILFIWPPALTLLLFKITRLYNYVSNLAVFRILNEDDAQL